VVGSLAGWMWCAGTGDEPRYFREGVRVFHLCMYSMMLGEDLVLKHCPVGFMRGLVIVHSSQQRCTAMQIESGTFSPCRFEDSRVLGCPCCCREDPFGNIDSSDAAAQA
jgi:hypothetical protein